MSPLSHGLPGAEPTGGPVVDSTFTVLAAILMTEQLAPNCGNLWVWPGTHLRHAEYFRAHGPQMFCAYPPIDLPAPEQITGRAGDLVLAHHLLGHNIGGNDESERTSVLPDQQPRPRLPPGGVPPGHLAGLRTDQGPVVRAMT
jgi:hypothetical protein